MLIAQSHSMLNHTIDVKLCDAITVLFFLKATLCNNFTLKLAAAGFDDARETPNSGPSPIINIKKEKRETEEETKEILRKLEKDNVSFYLWCSLIMEYLS